MAAPSYRILVARRSAGVHARLFLVAGDDDPDRGMVQLAEVSVPHRDDVVPALIGLRQDLAVEIAVAPIVTIGVEG